MSDYTFIVNPKAGRGAAARAVSIIRKLCDQRRVSYDIRLTEKEGDGIELARLASGSTVVAVGGDGTVNEVVNGIVGTGKNLGVIPAGSGNDLTKSITVPLNVSDACETVLAGRIRSIDVGTVSCGESPGNHYMSGNHHGRHFVNGVGVGFDAAVAEKTRHMRYLTGTLRYIVAVLRTLGTYEAPQFRVDLDGEVLERKQLLIAIGNGKCAGGGFYLTPEASVDDGLLDVCLMDEMTVLEILRIMPRVMKGNHTHAKGVTLRQARQIAVSSVDRFFVHADGEIVGRSVNSVVITLEAKALNVIVGREAS